MSDYVDSMNLMNVQHDEEGYSTYFCKSYNSNPVEYLHPEDTYSCVVHRINQAIAYRAVHPDRPLPPPADILLKYSKPLPELVHTSEKARQKLIEAFKVTKGVFVIWYC